MDKKEGLDEKSLSIYFKEIENAPRLSREEEREIIKRAKQGDKEAIEKLLYAHLPFVVKIAKRYQEYGLPLGDLINEGNIGLLKALQKFDLSKNVRFLSYAVHWIKQRIKKALLRQAKIVKITEGARSKLKRIKEAELQLLQKNIREPTIEEIAKLCNLSVEEVKNAYVAAIKEISLDSPVNPSEEEDSMSWGEIIAQTALPSPEEYYKEIEKKELLEKIFSVLTEREAKIIKLYYGFEDGNRYNLEQIGRIFGISRERVRQLRNKAIE
ncbi:MAG TPA: RNA polymerase sigma factor RpoD/SigA, partial [Candidatus Desulfofervidus auxilii]|nr:RNA polymerase sigma factor RpoD/SigA [Candidatus Desulfofervidus auxilii]